MNIFHKVALQGLIKNRTRTFVTILGVALSTALITAVSSFAVSLQAYMVNGAIAKYGDWHMEIPDADESFVKQQELDSRVADAAALQNIGYAVLKGSKNPEKPYLFLMGFEPEDFDKFPIQMLSGRFPENGGEVVIPAHIAANGGVKISVGDTLALSVGNRMSGSEMLTQHDAYRKGEEALAGTKEKIYTVVGICQRPAIEEYTAPGYTLLTRKDMDASDHLSVFITLKNPYQIKSYADSVSEESGYVLNDYVLRFLGLSGETWIVVLLFAAGGILVALVMAGSIFLIYNSFHISLNERTHQFGILMSVGATERQLKHSVLFEGLCIGFVGIPLGVLLGIPSIRFVLSLVEKNFANVLYDNADLTLKVSTPTLAAAVFVSFVTILISAYLPAKKAAHMPVMECIRQTNEIKVEAKEMKTSKYIERIYGLEEMLAFKNFKRNKGRYSSIILSLTLSVVLAVAADSFGKYLNQTAGSAQVMEDYDICFYTRGMEESDFMQLYENLKTVPDVTQSSFQAVSRYLCKIYADDSNGHFLEEFGMPAGYGETDKTVEVGMDIQFVEENIYYDLLEKLHLPVEEYSGEDSNMVIAGMLPDHYYTQENPMEFTLCDASGTEVKTIRASFITESLDGLPAETGEWHGYSLTVIAPYQIKPQFDLLNSTLRPTKYGMTFQSKNSGRSASLMKNIIEGTGITADYEFLNLHQITEENRNIVFIVNLFSAVFILMISLIAAANVFNTISTNIKLRRRELAMLRSIGMSDQKFHKMMRFECVLYGARTLLFSMPLSVLLSFLIYLGLNGGKLDGELTFVFPWQSLGFSILGVFLVVFLTMLYTTAKIRKENIIDALRDDIE